ncbi:hypothetical protein JW964_19935 [candidate division KSB1 bacterium]|nr:hypothetical protein [candidate division KSB1 bacterium]
MDKTIRTLLVIAGIISLLFSIFHLFFYKIFNWSVTLACLDQNNRAIFLTFNLATILMILMITCFSLFYAKELINNKLSRPLLSVFALFYLIRIFSEFLYFGYHGFASLIIILLCLVPAMIYLGAFAFNIKKL